MSLSVATDCESRNWEENERWHFAFLDIIVGRTELENVEREAEAVTKNLLNQFHVHCRQ